MPSNLLQKNERLADPTDNASDGANRPHKADPNSGLWVRAAKAVVYAGKRISDAAKILFVIIRDYQGDNPYAWVSIETLAHDTEKTTRRVQQLVKELEAAGAIQVVERPGLVNHYRTCFLELKPEQTQTSAARTNEPQAQTARPNLVSMSPKVISYPGSQASLPKETVPIKKELPGSSQIEQPAAPQLLRQPQPFQDVAGCQQLSFGWHEEAITAQPVKTKAAKGQLAPLKEVAPLPLKEISPKLEPTKLEIIVCKNAPAPDSNLRQSKSGRVRAGLADFKKEKLLLPKPTGLSDLPDAKPGQSQSQLTTAQNEVCGLLCAEGLAFQEAQKLAVLSHNISGHVLPWIEYARTRHNPAGYLRTVLLMADSRPPTEVKSRPEFGTAKNQSRPVASPQSGPIDFSKFAPGGKYAYLIEPPKPFEVEETASASRGSILEQEAEQDYAYEQPAPVVSRTIDPQLKSMIRQLDRTAYANLKQAYVEDKTLYMKLYNVGHTPKTANWLPFFSDLGVTAICLL